MVAIDGKALRRSYNREDRTLTIHMVSGCGTQMLFWGGCDHTINSVAQYWRGHLLSHWKNGKITIEQSYYIGSKALILDELARAVRGRWAINSLHWVLDVTMS